MGKYRDYSECIGKTFNRLKVADVIRKTIENSTGKDKTCVYFVCECNCGSGIVKEILPKSVLSGNTKSCGCIHKERMSTGKIALKHGLRYTRLYNIWRVMIERCEKPYSKNYVDYGGRGITVCDEWRHDFKAFYDWAYANGYKEDIGENGINKLTIDRRNNERGYSPDNCRWVTQTEQMRNTRLRKSNISGVNGVIFLRGKWCAQMNVNGKHIHLGFYDSIEAAAEARATGEKRYWGEAI